MEITCDRELNPNNSNHFKLYTWSEKIKETNKKIYIKKPIMSENFWTPETKSQTLNNKNENSKLENVVS